jgi:SAM-dependent methyltransferase
VLDIGCGRGELLDLLAEVGVPAGGVDLDASMLARCEAKGLDVELGDAVAVLDAVDKGSLGAVTWSRWSSTSSSQTCGRSSRPASRRCGRAA